MKERNNLKIIQIILTGLKKNPCLCIANHIISGSVVALPM